MKKIVLIAIAFPLFYSCKQKHAGGIAESGYVNHDKWMDRGYIQRRPFRGKPKEVKETLYRKLSDTMLTATGEFMRYSLWQFDTAGNQVLSKHHSVSRPASAPSVDSFTYDENGRHEHQYINADTNDKNAEVFSSLLSTRTGYGKFKLVSAIEGKPVGTTCTITFEGDSVVREEWSDKKEIISADIERYDKENKLLSRQFFSGDKPDKTDHLYYSAKGYLDSVITIRDNKVISKEVYINNEQGDPVFYQQLFDSVVYQREHYSYIYDDKGNWTRKLTRLEIDGAKKDETPAGDVYPMYTLRVREIKY
jgi:hypothetical protein